MGKKVLNIPQHEATAASISGAAGAYVNVGVVLQNPVRMLLMENLTDGYVQISLDGGSSDAFVLAPMVSVIFDFTSNSKHLGQHEDGPLMGKGIQVQVKQLSGFTAVSTGKVFLSGFYEQNDG